MIRENVTAPGNGNIIKFMGNKLERYFDNKIDECSDFTIKDSVIRISNTSSTHFIVFGQDSYRRRFARLEKGKLMEFIGHLIRWKRDDVH